MDNGDQNWYRQLLGLVLLSVSRATVEYITNPGGRDDIAKQLKGAFKEIDYDAAAKALTQVIDNVAATSKHRLTGTIDTLRDKSVDAVDEAKAKAEKQLGKKKKGRKSRFIIGMVLGALAAYYLLDEQRRDDLLDRLTGATGPIQQATESVYQQAASTAQQAADKAPDVAKDVAQQAAESVKKAADQAKNPPQA